MAFAGLVILVSLGLAQLQSPMWLMLTAFVGLNLIQASFTGFCSGRDDFQTIGDQGGNGVPVRGQATLVQRQRPRQGASA